MKRWLPGADAAADGPRERPDRAHLAAHRAEGEELESPLAPALPDLPLPHALRLSASLLREAGAELRRLGFEHRVVALARIARSWRDPDDASRREALEATAAETGLTEESVAWGLDAAFGAVTEDALRRWWARSGGAVGTGLRLTGHVWAGNVFVAGLPPVLASLLAGVPALVKAPGALPSFAALFARSVMEHAPELGPCVGAAAWGRQDGAATSALLGAVDHLYAFGDDETIAALRAARPEGVGLSAFGDRYSVGVLGTDAGDAELRGLAEDVLAYDGAGCLTPKWVFVLGAQEAESLARRAAPILEEAASRLPARPLPAGPGARRAAWLGAAAFGGWEAHGPGWAVAALPAGAPLSDPPPRTLCFVPVAGAGALRRALEPLGPRLQGLAGEAPAGAGLEALGLSVVAPLGRLQRPEVDWVHDGVDALAVLCRA